MYDIKTITSEKRYKILSMRFLESRSKINIADQLQLPEVMIDEFLNSSEVKKIRSKPNKTYLKELTKGFSFVLIDENHPDRREYGI